MRGSAYIFLVGIVMVLMVLSGCSSDRKANEVMDRAEALMEQHPDSALSLLESVDTTQLGSIKSKARYALYLNNLRYITYSPLFSDTLFNPNVCGYLEKRGTPEERMLYFYLKGILRSEEKKLSGIISGSAKCF